MTTKTDSKWIRVEDGLPEEGISCLVFTDFKEVALAWRGLNMGCWITFDGGDAEPIEVTHWQPMPDGPED